MLIMAWSASTGAHRAHLRFVHSLLHGLPEHMLVFDSRCIRGSEPCGAKQYACMSTQHQHDKMHGKDLTRYTLQLCLILPSFGYRESQQWISGQNPQQEPAFLGGRSAVVWAREYSTEDARRCDCNALQEALGKIPGSKRMVNWLSNLPQAHKLLHTNSCTHTHLSSSNLPQHCRTELYMSACLAPLHLAVHFAICGLHIGLTCGGMTHVVLAAPSCSFGYCSAQIRSSSSAQVVWPKSAWHSADRLHIPFVSPC